MLTLESQVTWLLLLGLGVFWGLERSLTDPTSTTYRGKDLLPREWLFLGLAFSLVVGLVVLPGVLPVQGDVLGASPVATMGSAYVAVLSVAQALGLATVSRQPSYIRNTVRYLTPVVLTCLLWYARRVLADADFLTQLDVTLGAVVALAVGVIDHAVDRRD